MKIQIKLILILLVVFGILTVIRQNIEFMFYGITLIIFTYLLYIADKKYDFTPFSLWMFVIWLISHVLGGLATYNGTVFYSIILIPLVGEPYNILKYDQIVHSFCYFAITLLVYRVITKSLRKDTKISALYILTFLAAIGIGSLNEVIEFLAVVFIPNTNVGGYFNTGIDMIANSLGSLIAILYLHFKNN